MLSILMLLLSISVLQIIFFFLSFQLLLLAVILPSKQFPMACIVKRSLAVTTNSPIAVVAVRFSLAIDTRTSVKCEIYYLAHFIYFYFDKPVCVTCVDINMERYILIYIHMYMVYVNIYTYISTHISVTQIQLAASSQLIKNVCGLQLFFAPFFMLFFNYFKKQRSIDMHFSRFLFLCF